MATGRPVWQVAGRGSDHADLHRSPGLDDARTDPGRARRGHECLCGAGEASEERVHKLAHTAHEHCFVANSLTAHMTLQPTVEVSP